VFLPAVTDWGKSEMWTRTTDMLQRIWIALRRNANQRNTEKERAHFWAEVRDGQDEAEQAERKDES